MSVVVNVSILAQPVAVDLTLNCVELDCLISHCWIRKCFRITYYNSPLS